jgi:hypothetical protein
MDGVNTGIQPLCTWYFLFTMHREEENLLLHCRSTSYFLLVLIPRERERARSRRSCSSHGRMEMQQNHEGGLSPLHDKGYVNSPPHNPRHQNILSMQEAMVILGYKVEDETTEFENLVAGCMVPYKDG